MVMTKHEDVTKQGFCKKLGRLWESLLFVLIQLNFNLIVTQVNE